jgi:uncharacterized membrane protein YfhO
MLSEYTPAVLLITVKNVVALMVPALAIVCGLLKLKANNPPTFVNVFGRLANNVEILIFLSVLDWIRYSKSAEFTVVAAVNSDTLLSAMC